MAFSPCLDSEKSHEETAYFARLAALNAALEAVRMGAAARGFAHGALSSDAVLEKFLHEIQLRKNSS